MSGSYDRPGGPRPPQPPGGYPVQRQQQPAPQRGREAAPPTVPAARGYPQPHQLPQNPLPQNTGPYTPNYEEFYADEPTAVPPTARQQGQLPANTEPELVAHSRQDATVSQKHTPIVPAGSVTGRSLTLVVAIMCFLACLTAGAVYMINQSASAWLRDIASEVTVQIEPREKLDMDRAVRELSQFLTREPGITGVKPLSLNDSAALLEPWLGQTDVLKTLPMPRLIAVELDRNAPPDLDQLRAQIIRQFPAATLDDHRLWQSQIRAVTRSLALGGIAILLLVAAATTAIIISATRSAMASNREIVEVLHYVGATDRLIAREFERHFLRLGIKAGMIGALSAMAMFFALPFAMQVLGGGTVTQAEMARLFGTGSLDMVGYLLLVLVVVVIAALSMLTSRVSVKRILHAQG